MATTEMQLPEIGEGVTEGELVTWLVKEGDAVAVDQPVAELMTDKATVEVPSSYAGTVKDLKFGEGDVIEVGATMLTIEEGAGATASAPAPVAAASTPAPAATAGPGKIQNMELPEIGEGVTEGELVVWLVKEGDAVALDQPVAELMTDKATVEVPSSYAGTVKDLKFGEGDVIEVGATMLTIETGAGAPAAATSATTPVSAPAPQPAMTTAGPEPQPRGGAGTLPPMSEHVLATPSTRRLARESGVNINTVSGTGLAGRVTREDVLQQVSQGGAPAATTSPAKGGFTTPARTFAAQGEEVREPLKGIRKKIAENMQMAKHVIPHFTLMDEANVTELVELRKSLKPEAEARGVKVTYMPFVMKALMATVREFPKFNSSIDDEAKEIVTKKYFNIGFAADTPNGLLVPVIKSADQKTIFDLSGEVVDLATRARAGKLALDEMKGATFTITNIGSVGGSYATPIINHPEVAIFGMYKIQERPFIANGELEVGHFMNFTVTCDHRLIDGAEAARFLAAFIKRIENPGVLMMDMI